MSIPQGEIFVGDQNGKIHIWDLKKDSSEHLVIRISKIVNCARFDCFAVILSRNATILNFWPTEINYNERVKMVFKRKKLKYIFQLNWKCQLMKKGMIIEWNISRIILHFLYHADHLQDTIIINMYQVVCTVVFVYISSSNLDTQYWKKIVHVFEREILDFFFPEWVFNFWSTFIHWYMETVL